MADATAVQTPSKSNGVDSSTAALKASLVGMLPQAIANQQAQSTAQDAKIKAAQEAATASQQDYDQTADQMEAQYDAALSHANDVAQRQRSITLDITKGIWKFAPIALAFGLLAGKETGGNVATGVSVMMQGLAGFANGRYQQYKDAYGQWKDSLDQANSEVKDTLDRAKEIMGNKAVDVNTRMKQLQIETTAGSLLNKASLTNDPQQILKAITDLERAHGQFAKAQKTADAKANPTLSPELKAMAANAVTSLMPSPQMSPKLKALSPAMQLSSTDMTAYKVRVADWKTKSGSLELQLAQKTQIYMADGYDMPSAMRMAIGHFEGKHLLPTGDVSFAGDVYHFAPPETTPSAQSGAVTVAGRTFPADQIQAAMKKYGKTRQQVIDGLKAKLGG